MAAALRWLAFAACAAVLVLGQAGRTWSDAERYGYLADIMPSDWLATNVWLDSTDCAVARGVWLALCEDGRLVPISERAVADDPGHALLLGAWAAATGKRATLVDVARLNTLLDTLGLLALAALLAALRAWIAAVVLMALGPAEYLGWMGTSPHWSYIGMASLAAILPLAVAARAGRFWVASGLAALALVTLVRESIGMMGLAVTVAAIVLDAVRPPRRAPLALVLVLAAMAFLAPKWVTMARDAAFDMAPAERLQTHGLSHTLYLGLGFVENKWGIRYDDAYGEEIANREGVVFCSPEYFRLMWRLYLARLVEDPGEIARIYADKAWRLLAAPTLHPGPPFGVVLALGLLHLLAASRTQAWRRIGFEPGQPIEMVSLAFLGLFLAQAALALPSHMYAVPANGFILVLLGTIVEFVGRALWTWWRERDAREWRPASSCTRR